MSGDDPERALALSYAPAPARAALAALFALDATLAQILRTTREPLVGQMRLTWWHEALSALDTAPPPAQPVLQALAAEVLPQGVTGAILARMIDGWEALLEADPLSRTELMAHAQQRGVVLFEAAGAILGCPIEDRVAAAGAGWALVDLAAHLSDVEIAASAGSLAAVPLGSATARRWSRAGRPLGALAHIARMDLAYPSCRGVPRGAPKRVARLAWHRLTGQ
ncbi:squalene/phytoene synthase family protein [Sphingomonas sp.]|uniref:squalene/phytoene synthase family protein n=1 Tax=Sphingomonas sp. TaxID=28214 RepID=UPI00333F9AFE